MAVAAGLVFTTPTGVRLRLKHERTSQLFTSDLQQAAVAKNTIMIGDKRSSSIISSISSNSIIINDRCNPALHACSVRTHAHAYTYAHTNTQTHTQTSVHIHKGYYESSFITSIYSNSISVELVLLRSQTRALVMCPAKPRQQRLQVTELNRRPASNADAGRREQAWRLHVLCGFWCRYVCSVRW